MFEKRKLESYRRILHDTLVAQGRLAGSTVASGFVKKDRKERACIAYLDKLGNTIREDLGDEGVFELTYGLDKTLKLLIGFSWGKNDPEYGLIEEIFYRDEEESDDEKFCVYNDLTLHNILDTQTTEIEYKQYNVAPEELEARTDRMIDYIFNLLDIFYENLQEEYGEGDEDE